MAFFDIFKKKQDTPPSEEQARKQQQELSAGLEKTKTGLFSKLARAVAGRSTVDADVLDDLEEVLISSDVGVETTVKIIRRIEERVARDKYMNASELQSILREEITALMEDAHGSSEHFGLDAAEGQPYVVMVVGVNGAGKTTTIGKLAAQLTKAGRKVWIGAADTFRAAAIDQLQVWADRAGATMIRQQMGSDPASVAFDTLTSAKSNGADVVLIDTAGRLHNKVNLMNELTKIRNVMAKVIPGAPHEVMLVLDGSTGQNAFEQAKQFTQATQVTSLTITKLDGTAKGGVVIERQRPVPHSGPLHRYRRRHRPATHLRPPGVRQRAVRRWKKINVITLGCSKNTVDSEHLMARLAAAGYEVLFDSDRTDAKVVVINTCGFIGDAKQESIDMILRAAAAKQAGKIERLFVVGCLSERYADELRAEIPEVDEYFGARTWDGIVRALGASEDPALATERRLTTPKHYAYLKISEGCNWKCGYCAIPLIRGGHVSVPMEELEEEARKLAAQGVRELMVIAQDTTYYGIDLYGRRMLAELLRRLCRIDGIAWIRLHYAYPAAFPDEVIEVMAAEPKICKYLDIPFQHISDAQLAAMHRRHTKAEAMELIRRLRTAIPDLALRTTLLGRLSGRDGSRFRRASGVRARGAFRTARGLRLLRGGGDLFGRSSCRDDVPEAVKQERVERIMALQNVDFARKQPAAASGRDRTGA